MRRLFPLRWVRHIYDLFNPEESARLAGTPPASGTQRKNQFYEYLAVLSEKKGYAFAGNRILAEKFGVSTRTIQRWIKTLDESGLITVEHYGKTRRIYPGARRKQEQTVRSAEEKVSSLSPVSPIPRQKVMATRHDVADRRQNVARIKSSGTAPDLAVPEKKQARKISRDASIDEICEILWGNG